jgi:hypothetical protein
MMLAALRRSRLLAAFLVALSPAAAGTLLPAIHPCPVDSPWLAAHESHTGHSGHAGHGAGSLHAPAADHHRDVCHCIGCCLMGAASLPAPTGVAIARVVMVPAAAAWPSHDASLHLAPKAALLPPSTAPPQG